MHTAQAVTNLDMLATAERKVGVAATETVPAFEMLYEVTGYDRTNLDATLIHQAPLDYRVIWGGEPSLMD